jgi:GT2 family glycosyltransferase
MARVSVVIVSWNCRDATLACLGSLRDPAPAAVHEIVVVDNGSADGTVAAVADRYPTVRVLANPTNRGLAAANNQGLVATTGDAVLLSNADVVYRPGAVAALAALLDRRPRAAFAIPRLVDPDGARQTSAGDLPTLREALLGRQAQRHRAATAGFWWDGWTHDEERKIGRGHEAAFLVRRRAVEEVGLQDERYPLDWEGIDWTERMRRAGWEVWFCPDAEVVHEGGASVRQVPVRWVVSTHRGMYRYFRDRRPVWWAPLLAGAVATRAAVKLAGLAGPARYERSHRGRG